MSRTDPTNKGTAAVKIDGLNLTDTQLAKVKAVCEIPELVSARKAITLYKADDPDLALFRIQAASALRAITVRAVLNIPLKVAQAQYVNRWLVDGNNMFRVYFAALNRAVGREYIQGAGR